MNGRDPVNAKIFSARLKEVLESAKIPADTRVDDFLKVMQKVLTKEAPEAVRAAKVHVVGAYFLGTTTASAPHVDLHVVVPPKQCSAEDVRKHGWLDARTRFLANLCRYLRDTHKMVAEVVRDPNNFNKYMVTIAGPNVVGASAEGDAESKHWTIRLHAGAKLTPQLLEYLKQPATFERSPVYAQMVLEDALRPALYDALHDTAARLPVITNAAVLLRVWVEKQGLVDAPDGLSHDVLHGLLHSMAAAGNISEGMTVEQCVRCALQFLADLPRRMDLSHAGAHQLSSVCPSVEELMGLQGGKYPLVMHYQGWNIAYNLTEQSVAEMAALAREAVATLDRDSAEAAIASLFRIPAPFWLKYDMYLAMRYPSDVTTTVRPDGITPAHHDAAHSIRYDFHTLLHAYLRLAFGDNIVRARARTFPDGDGGEVVVFGLGLWAANAFPSYDIVGPEVKEKAAVETFVKLWGAKARNKTVQGQVKKVASFANEDTNAAFVTAVLKTLLRELDNAGSVRVLGQGATDGLLVQPGDGSSRYDPMRQLFFPIKSAFDELTSYLTQLDSFPLSIQSVDAAHCALWNTAVAPPHPHVSLLRTSDPQVPHHLLGYGEGVEPMEIVLTFQKSSAWPSHKDAIDHIKISLYCKLAQRLRKERRLVCIPRRDCCDVLVHGHVFRMYVFHPREVDLLRNLGLDPIARVLHKQLDLLPRHGAYISAYTTFFEAYAPGVRMLKRWAAAHFMNGYITDEALELLVAKSFSMTNPPRTALTAFARALHLLTAWDWEHQPMIVPPTTFETHSISKRRVQGPAMCFNTAYDSELTVFSFSTPNKTMLRRAQRLAEATLTIYFDNMAALNVEESWEAKWAGMFATSLKPFDLLITLNKNHVARAMHNPATKRTMGDAADVEKYPKGYLFRPNCGTRREELHRMINYNPVDWYLTQLRRQFREHCLFAYDPYGGTTIGVVGTRKLSGDEAFTLAEHFNGMGRGIVKRVQASLALQQAAAAEAGVAPAEDEPTSATPSPATAPKRKAKKVVKKRTRPADDDDDDVPEENGNAQDAADAPAPAAAAAAKKPVKKRVVKKRKVAA